MSRGPDIIRWVIDWMMTNENAITEELALRCERDARREWGGQTIPYIAKQCDADRAARLQAARANVDAGLPVAEAARRAGIGRTTLYDHLATPADAKPAADDNASQDGRISLGGSRRFGAGSVRRSP